MGVCRLDISCNFEVLQQGIIYFRYEECNSVRDLHLMVSDEKLLKLEGKLDLGRYRSTMDKDCPPLPIGFLEETLSATAYHSLREGANGLPEKLRDALGL